ncbi:MAG: HTH-type transcriptional activator IlvY [Aestuariibacter sp.]
MDLRGLQLFQHLANSLHFGKTSEAMFVSPSTLSRAIQRLEQEVGADLFIRDNRSVRLTPVGERMRQFVDVVNGEWQSLQHDVNQHSQALTGELSVFCTVTASMSHLPGLLDGFRRDYPQIEIKLATGNPGESAERILQQQADIAIAIHTPNFPKELHFVPLDTVRLILIAPKSSHIQTLEDVRWQSSDMILPDSGPSKRIVHHWLAERGIRPRVYASVGGNEAILSMVALGCGIAIVPEIVVDLSTVAGRVNKILINDIEPYHLGVCCLKKRNQEPIIQAFLKHC